MIKFILPMAITLTVIQSGVGIKEQDTTPKGEVNKYYLEQVIKDVKQKVEFKNPIYIEKEDKKEPKIKENEIKVLYNSSVKSYMDGNKITNKSSKQYKYINSDLVDIDERGHYYSVYKDIKFYGVALGSYFGEIGSKYRFELSSGKSIYVIKLDEKKDKHTYDNFIHKSDGSVIEFVIKESKAKKYYPHKNGYVNNGNFNNYNEFSGKIEKIYKID